MNLENIILSLKNQPDTKKTNIIWLHLYEISRMEKFIEKENRYDQV